MTLKRNPTYPLRGWHKGLPLNRVPIRSVSQEQVNRTAPATQGDITDLDERVDQIDERVTDLEED